MIKSKLANIILATLIGMIIVVSLTPAPVIADEESSTGAEVNVIEKSEEIYGSHIVAFNNVLFAWQALGEPNRFSAWFFGNGWIELQLSETVADCTTVNIWAGYIGFKNFHVKVYTSLNGEKWKPIGNLKLNNPQVDRYTLTGNYGDVRYIKLSFTGSRWTIGMLDAVSAKGGDVETDSSDRRK